MPSHYAFNFDQSRPGAPGLNLPANFTQRGGGAPPSANLDFSSAFTDGQSIGGTGDLSSSVFNQGAFNTPQDGQSFNFRDFLLGEVGEDGKRGNSLGGQLGSLALGGAQSYLGLRGLRNAERSLDFQMATARENLDLQKATTNRQLEDRQRARVEQNPGSAISVADYMAKFGV